MLALCAPLGQGLLRMSPPNSPQFRLASPKDRMVKNPENGTEDQRQQWFAEVGLIKLQLGLLSRRLRGPRLSKSLPPVRPPPFLADGADFHFHRMASARPPVSLCAPTPSWHCIGFDLFERKRWRPPNPPTPKPQATKSVNP